MKQENAIKIFEDRKVRTLWNDEQEKWYFSIVDVIEILTDSVNPRDYWFKIKIKVIVYVIIPLSFIF